MFNTPANIRTPWRPNAGIDLALSMLEGHWQFMQRNTGTSYDSFGAGGERFVTNDEGVLADSRHARHPSRMVGLPNDATTEGQSLQIIGYAYAYLATGDAKYLDAAKWYYDAYIEHFYGGIACPEDPWETPWHCQWIVNCKEPVLANYPLSTDGVATHGGFKDVLISYSAGIGQVPHGAPYFGDYLDVAYQAYVGQLGWSSMVATIVALDTNGKPLWGSAGTAYPVDWIITWSGEKVSSTGQILSTGHAHSEIGTIKLKDTSVNGTLKTTFAAKLPVELGGYMIPRNAPVHNRPGHFPVLNPSTYGNASDGEEWMCDAAYLLWKITGEAKYQKVFQATLANCVRYAAIDSDDKFFRQSLASTKPFTDGISYDYTYPAGLDLPERYSRDAQGYITIDCPQAAQWYLEQQAIWPRVDTDSTLQVTAAGAGITCQAVYFVGPEKTAVIQTAYYQDVPLPPDGSIIAHTVPVASLLRLLRDDGHPYVLGNPAQTSVYGGATAVNKYEADFLDGRSCNVCECTIPNTSAGIVLGFWNTPPSNRLNPTNLVYRSNKPLRLRLVDADSWHWEWILPNTSDNWVSHALNKADLVARGHQPVHGSTPPPAGGANYADLYQMTLILPSGTDAVFAYHCFNDLPPKYAGINYIIKARICFTGAAAFTAKLGDCYCPVSRVDSLAYCPGVIPFSNITQDGTEKFAGWRGLPYPGYQHPFIWTQPIPSGLQDVYLNNMVDFLYDSQAWFASEFGELGPGASAYLWHRWDSAEYGPPDTWTMHHWGDKTAWSGYQPRAYFSAARAWHQLVLEGRTPPAKLAAYVDNWSVWLVNYVQTHQQIPRDFKPDGTVLGTGFTGHQTGLWLAGACCAALSGSTVSGLDSFIDACVAQLASQFPVLSAAHAMNGGWSPAVRESSNDGMFYGFWSGEILRGLGLYIMYKRGRQFYNPA